jgi:putative membrane protein insertion efficiency factor
VPALRQRLRRPETWLALLAVLVALALADSQRDPSHQLLGHAYIAAVGLYQVWGHPILEGHVRCRFRPTCSVYSVEAVKRYGIVRGLRLTIERLYSCRPAVPMGTYQPVP